LEGAAWLEHHLENDDHACDDEAGEECEHERPSAHPDEPCGQARPERERERLHPDHDPDRVLERHRGDIEQKQQGQWRNRQKQEARLEAHVRPPFAPCWPPTEVDLKHERCGEHVRGEDGDDRPENDQDHIDQSQVRPAVVYDQHAHERDGGCDDASDRSRTSADLEGITEHNGERKPLERRLVKRSRDT
jgi:hypothetical protein